MALIRILCKHVRITYIDKTNAKESVLLICYVECRMILAVNIVLQIWEFLNK